MWKYQISLVILILIGAIVGYLFGSIVFAIIISKSITKTDIRTKGSNNPGFTNSIRVYGKKIAILVLVLDVLKSVVPVILFYLIYQYVLSLWIGIPSNPSSTNFYDPKIFIYIPGIFAIIGHIFPIYFKFKGGKGVATYGGLCICLSPFITLVAIVIIATCVLITKKMSIGSLVSACIVPFLVLVPGINYLYLYNPQISFFIKDLSSVTVQLLPVFAMLVLMSGLVIFSHRENIKKIINKTENSIISKN